MPIISNIIGENELMVDPQIIIYHFCWTKIKSIFGQPCNSYCCSKCNVNLERTLKPLIPKEENVLRKITYANLKTHLSTTALC